MNIEAGLESLIHEAVAHQNAGRLDEAGALYRQVLARQPDQPDALHFLGIIHRIRGDLSTACDLIKKCLALAPQRGIAHYDLGVALSGAQRYEEALDHLRAAAELEPSLAHAHFMTGIVLRELQRREASIGPLRTAVLLAPDLYTSHWALCASLQEIGDIDGLLAAAEEAIPRFPSRGEFHVYRSEALFAKGRLQEAWEEYEFRYATENAIPLPKVSAPQWRGEDLNGRSILLWIEQGVGDVLMYASMIPDLAKQATRCVVAAPPRFTRLFQRSFPGAEVIESMTMPPTDQFDFQSSISSLGRWLRPSFETFPTGSAYLVADRQRVSELRRRYLGGSQGFLVGVVWRSSRAPNEREKSINFGLWGAILNVPGVTFVSLQYGDCDSELAQIQAGFGTRIIRDTDIDPLGDLDAYAAQVAAMDMVVSSGNAAAHLAGSLGVATICMLPKSGGRGRRWYWFAERLNCPWYPSVRRLVQTKDGDWTAVIAEAAIHVVDTAYRHNALPSPAKYLGGLANSYRKAGLGHELALTLKARLAYEPFHKSVAIELAGQQAQQGDHASALETLDFAVAREPTSADLWNRHGSLLDDMNRLAEARRSFERALAIKPDSHLIRNNLATSYRKSGMLDDALDQYRRAYAADSKNTSIILNLAGCLAEEGQTEQSLALFEKLFEHDPDNVEARYSHAQVLVGAGRFDQGWPEFQWRWRRPQANVRPELFPGHLWNGERLAGQRVLAYTEQGIGDEILVASMIPDLDRAARETIFLCSSRLVPLFRRSFPNVVVDHRAEPLPDSITKLRVDLQMSLSELGSCFRRKFSDFPAHNGYLKADPVLAGHFRSRYQSRRPGCPVVGIAWRSVNPEIGHLKGGQLSEWKNLLATPNVTFVDLQYGDTREERAAAFGGTQFELLHDEAVDALVDIDVAAAQVAAMDLVISVSNSTVHLAGGLGVPTWTILNPRRGRLWYWFRGQERSPWYPSVILHQADVGLDTIAPDSKLLDALMQYTRDFSFTPNQ